MARIAAATPEAARLLIDGAIALAECEAAGMRINVPYLHKALRKTKERIQQLEGRMRDDPIYRRWHKRYGSGTNLGSRAQLADILFNDMGYETKAATATGRAKADKTALERIDLPFIKWFIQAEQLKKLRSTSLIGIQRELVGDLVHSFFNLHTVRSYRSSSDSFNFQNIPIREPWLAKIIRRCFIARDGHRLVDIDFGQQEVRVAGCCCGDQRLIDDTVNGDMHRDMAAEIFFLPTDKVPKPARGTVKGGFVFAQFYGDWYKQCALNLWRDVPDIKLADGTPLVDHLRTHGIDELGACDPDEREPSIGTFERHLKEIEYRFWYERFYVYNDWRKQRWEEYKRDGWFRMVTGFVCSGIYDKKQVTNYPIQGPAFHCLLWSLIELLRGEMRRRKMRSLLVGQIHDSIIGDIHEAELDEFLVIARRVMTVDIVKAWPWLTVPLVVEAEVSLAGASWFDKQPYEIKD